MRNCCRVVPPSVIRVIDGINIVPDSRAGMRHESSRRGSEFPRREPQGIYLAVLNTIVNIAATNYFEYSPLLSEFEYASYNVRSHVGANISACIFIRETDKELRK